MHTQLHRPCCLHERTLPTFAGGLEFVASVRGPRARRPPGRRRRRHARRTQALAGGEHLRRDVSATPTRPRARTLSLGLSLYTAPYPPIYTTRLAVDAQPGLPHPWGTHKPPQGSSTYLLTHCDWLLLSGGRRSAHPADRGVWLRQRQRGATPGGAAAPVQVHAGGSQRVRRAARAAARRRRRPHQRRPLPRVRRRRRKCAALLFSPPCRLCV